MCPIWYEQICEPTNVRKSIYGILKQKVLFLKTMEAFSLLIHFAILFLRKLVRPYRVCVENKIVTFFLRINCVLFQNTEMGQIWL